MSNNLTLRAHRGPNIWAAGSVLEGLIDPVEWVPAPVREHIAFQLPAQGTVLRTLAAPGPFLACVARALLDSAGDPAPVLALRQAPSDDRALIAFEEEDLGRAGMLAAWNWYQAARVGGTFDPAGAIAVLAKLRDEVCLGPSTRAIVRAARQRGIPTRRLSKRSLVFLGWGSRQRRICTAETDRTRAIARTIASDKEITKSLLRAVGVPVAEGREVASPGDAWAAACAIGAPVVVKPLNRSHGYGVSIGLVDRAAIESAFHYASEDYWDVIVERMAIGSEHRLLVVGDRMVAASRGDAVHVVGDGEHDIQALIALQINTDPRRGPEASCPLDRIELTPAVELLLSQSGHHARSVPVAGERVLIQYRGNHAFDVTDQVHPTVACHAVEAARVVGLDVAGIDIVAEDISRPLEEQGGIVVEVNSGPGLDLHLMPASGSPRPVGEAILDSLFEEGDLGLVPLAAVAGERGETRAAAAREIAHLWGADGRTVGLAGFDGRLVGGQSVRPGPAWTADDVRDLMLHPRIDAIVAEIDDQSVREGGLGFEYCDVVILLPKAVGAPDPDDVVTVVLLETLRPDGSVLIVEDDPRHERLRSVFGSRLVVYPRGEAREGDARALAARAARRTSPGAERSI